MTSDKDKSRVGGRLGDPAHDSPKRQGDKLGQVLGDRSSGGPSRDEAAGDPAHDSPKRHGDKLGHARDAAAGRGKDK